MYQRKSLRRSRKTDEARYNAWIKSFFPESLEDHPIPYSDPRTRNPRLSYGKSTELQSTSGQCNYTTPNLKSETPGSLLRHCLVIDQTHVGGLTSVNIFELDVHADIVIADNDSILYDNFIQLVVIPDPYKDVNRNDINGDPKDTLEIYEDANRLLEDRYQNFDVFIPSLQVQDPAFPNSSYPFSENEVDPLANYVLRERFKPKMKSFTNKIHFHWKSNKSIPPIVLNPGESIMLILKCAGVNLQGSVHVMMATRTSFKYTKN